MTKQKPLTLPSTPEEIRALANANWFGAVDALGCIALLKEASRSEAIQSVRHPAHRAADLAARALMVRVLLWGIRAFDPIRTGDLHLAVAFRAMHEHAGLREEVTAPTEALAMHLAHQRWAVLCVDPRVEAVRHYRNKYVAHLSLPNPTIGTPFTGQVFGLTEEVALCCAQLAHATGINTLSLEGQVAVLAESSEVFWPGKRSLSTGEGGR